MEKESKNAEPISKSFMTAGPTLHYSHPHVYRHWWTTLILYVAVCFFWSKILTGGAVASLHISSFQFDNIWTLGKHVVSPISIYEYPWHIIVLGTLMGIIGVVPILMSQLLSSRYSVLFILISAFVAGLPGLAICLIISCIAVATRPLRFRSRFISLVLCTTPILVYWAIFGGIKSIDPVRWGYSYAPWLTAWLISLLIAGIVLAIGHFTRYRPGLTWITSLLFFSISLAIFYLSIGFAEADYQIYVKQNDPAEMKEFHTKKITPILDSVVRDPEMKTYLSALFFSDEQIVLRSELKREMQDMLRWNLWSDWFSNALPEEFDYETKRIELLKQYQTFIDKHPNNRDRMPIALYYKGILKELSPDIRAIGTEETLRFYTDYPKREVIPIWSKLYNDFPESRESIEARWRIAMHLAGRGEFEKANSLCKEAIGMLSTVEFTTSEIQDIKSQKIFKRPEETVITQLKAEQLTYKLQELQKLIDGENLNEDQSSRDRLAKFIMLNPYMPNYSSQLDAMLDTVSKDDPLQDNLLLAKAKLLEDSLLKEKVLENIIQNYNGKDGAIQSYYELGLLRVQLWRTKAPSNAEERSQLLGKARKTFEDLVQTYPSSIYTERAVEILRGLPVNN